MIATIPNQILYLLKLRETAPIEDIVYINSILASLEYIKLIMEVDKNKIVEKNDVELIDN